MLEPPTLRELVKDPVYRAYLKEQPDIPDNLAWGNPWMIYVNLKSGGWLRKKSATYPLPKTVKLMKDERVRDVAIVSLRKFFEPPVSRWEPIGKPDKNGEVEERAVYWLPTAPFDWCWRCRRPTTFMALEPRHHALIDRPALDNSSPYRCYYCGIRQVAMPSVRMLNFRTEEN